MEAATAPRQWLLLLRFLLVIGFAVETVWAQVSTTNATTTDPVEARALETMFQRWGISATNQWNHSGELCSGAATDSTLILDMVNPAIKCLCSFNNGTSCRITALKVYEMDVSGPIPDELWNLTYLDDLNLARNYLTGPLPAAIGRLTRMQFLSFGLNALSGEIPRELGMLTDLRSLGLDINNFSGPLPLELGNLSRLTQLYIAGAGISGPIPRTFARLSSLEIVWASDNNFTGQVPDFIGNWSNIKQLWLQGTSLQGPIPQSFSNLTSLTDLRISDLSNGNSSLDFLRNMNSLSTLILRNNNISGSVPLHLGAFQSMTLLDLSFNSLTGTIPDSILNISSLTNLFLGNNKLTGALPSMKNPRLRNIDLSYNELSGSFPTWVSEQNLRLNLVSNNFTIDNSNGSALPPGLNCLQRSFPCFRGSPIYSRFAIKCGGPQIRASDRVLYERDDETLGPATYYMTETGRWAVSNIGLPSNSPNPTYRTNTSSQFTNTLDSELFQTARTSAGSLRYYGLGLENGNYNVTLQFAESQIVGTRTWKSVGRRVFDIYVQGNLVVKDFDITREAGGISLRAVARQFTVDVSENHLDIHLFWAGKGSFSVPTQGTYGPLISAISATPNFVPTVSNRPPGGNRNRTGLIVGIVVGVAAASLICLLSVYFVFWRRKKQKNVDDDEILSIEVQAHMFSYGELRAATDGFDPSNKLGEGGFGSVYKGTLGDGRAVAIKELAVASHQGNSQFLAEIATISAVNHRNLVQLYGCCIEGNKRLLVYEYLENKSLDKQLFRNRDRTLFLDWAIRYEICLGVARGLAYLHEESRPRIVHRDVKASNILLDSELTPKISDFGLAKLYDDKRTHMSTVVAGTVGYLAPEYAMRGQLTEKADIFSFGVLLLEIISGRPNTNTRLPDEMIYLLDWAWNLHENNREMELVDPNLHEYNQTEVLRIIGVALLCTQASPGLRPAMSRVVAMLSGDIEVSSATSQPSYLTDWMLKDETTFSSVNTDSLTFNTTTSHSHTDSTTRSGVITDPGEPKKPLLEC